jgi:uncharacterized OsmC-like protein
VATSAETFYKCEIEIENLPGPDRRATLPDGETVVYGTHGRIADYYGIDMTSVEPRASTLDHVVAATGASLAGTFSGILNTHGIHCDDTLRTTATGHMVIDNGVLVIDRIDVRYRLEVLHRQRDTAIHAHDLHLEHCPVARSLGAAITITTSLDLKLREPERAPIA